MSIDRSDDHPDRKGQTQPAKSDPTASVRPGTSLKIPKPGGVERTSKAPAVRLPRPMPSTEPTRTPPDVNPSGPPPREPFVPATSPKAPPTEAKRPWQKPPGELNEDEIDALLDPLKSQPTALPKSGLEIKAPPRPTPPIPAPKPIVEVPELGSSPDAADEDFNWDELESADALAVELYDEIPDDEEQDRATLVATEDFSALEELDLADVSDQTDIAPEETQTEHIETMPPTKRGADVAASAALDDHPTPVPEAIDAETESSPFFPRASVQSLVGPDSYEPPPFFSGPSGSPFDSEAPETPEALSKRTTVAPPKEPGELEPASEPAPAAPMTSFEAEQPAAAHLARRQLVDAWLERAAWFEQTAETLADSASKARHFLIASELWAMSGDVPRARQAAKRASQAAPSMALASRQSRMLASAEGDWKTVTSMLDAETRSSASPEARAHASYLSAELYRIVLSDSQSAQRKLIHAAQADPADPRPFVDKLCEQLTSNAAAPKLKRPDAPELSSLATALDDIVQLRSGAPVYPPPTPTLAFEQAVRALRKGDRARAGDAVRTLADVPGLEAGALWLAAALYAPSADTRPKAIECLRELLAHTPSRTARRTLASRALEQGDAEASQHAFTQPESEESAFSAADRVSLAALTGGDPETLRAAIADALNDETLAALVAAAISATSPFIASGLGDEQARAENALGRKLGTLRPGDSLAESLQALREVASHDPMTKLLDLELARSSQRHNDVAAELRQWPGEDPLVGRLAAAILRETTGDRESALLDYQAATAQGPYTEAALRAQLVPDNAEHAASMLAETAEGLGEDSDERKALLFYESALRTLSDPALAMRYLTRAAESSQQIPLPYRIADRISRGQADAAALGKWLELRRQASPDPTERAYDAVREALLVADETPDIAAALLAEAIEAHPDDLALREFHERLATATQGDRGGWRRALAAKLDNSRHQGRLLLEAAAEYERAGSLEDAAATVRTAAQLAGEFARLRADRMLSRGPEVVRYTEELAARAMGETDPTVKRELYEHVARVTAQHDPDGALAFHRMILEHAPDFLPSLRALEQAYVTNGAEDELSPIVMALSSLADANEGPAHAALALRFAARAGNTDVRAQLVQRALEQEPRPFWALREFAALASAENDAEKEFLAYRGLAERAERSFDRATLLLRAAVAAIRLGRFADAKPLLDEALEKVPTNPMGLTARAQVHEALGNPAAAAEDLEAFAAISAVREHQFDAWRQAAMLWLDGVGKQERGLVALEKAADIDINDDVIFERLQTIFVQNKDRKRLAELLERRLSVTEDADRRLALEVTRARALAELGDREAAKQALSAALESNPEHAEALEAYANLCMAERAFESAEQALIRLARVLPTPEAQGSIYRRLADLYDEDLPNAERAELCYREILKRQPDDIAAHEKLVLVYGKLGDVAKAVELQGELVQRATNPEEKLARTLQLAYVYETIAKDRKLAQTTLENSRKAYPTHGAVLKALVAFHRRGGEDGPAQLLIDRAGTEARRALSHGRFDAAFFDVLTAIAELKEDHDGARIAAATVAGLEGKPSGLIGAGNEAADPALDEWLAPELLSPPIRALFAKLPGVLDTAYPVDFKALRATPIGDEHLELAEGARGAASFMGFDDLEIFVSNAIGSIWMPVCTSPPQVLIGESLVDSEDTSARYFLLLRCLKAMGAQMAPLTRISPIELWPATAALLSLLIPEFQPQAVDAAKLAAAQQKLSPALPPVLDEDVARLATEIANSIGNRASQLGSALHQWGDRIGLLAIGDPATCFRAISMTVEPSKALPAEGPDRIKWIVRHPETRDLAVFSVSDQYAAARRKLGYAD